MDFCDSELVEADIVEGSAAAMLEKQILRVALPDQGITQRPGD
jgi:hypothetical protein